MGERAILLDLDGTLIDSRPGIAASCEAALRALGHAPDPAFDVTPNRYIHAIFTERGVAKAPYAESLRKLAAAPATGAAR